MSGQDSFSRRHQFASAKEITIREDAPEGLRLAVLETARELGWVPSRLRDVVCRVLRVRPDPSNWSDQNVWGEVQGLISGCDWYRVYDIIEALHRQMAENDSRRHTDDVSRFAAEVNAMFVEDGVGWQLVDGRVVTRGTEAFEGVVAEASVTLEETGRPTAAGHIHEALQDLSRRPNADLAGLSTMRWERLKRSPATCRAIQKRRWAKC